MKKNRLSGNMFFVRCIAFVVLFIVVGILSACANPDPVKPTEKVQATSIPSPTIEPTSTPFPFNTVSAVSSPGWSEVLRLGNDSGRVPQLQGTFESKHVYKEVFVCQGNGNLTVDLINAARQTVPCSSQVMIHANQIQPVKDEMITLQVTVEGDLTWAVSVQMSDN